MANTFITPEEFAESVVKLIRENAEKYGVDERELFDSIQRSMFYSPGFAALHFFLDENYPEARIR